MKTPYFAVIDRDTETIYVTLFANKEDAQRFADVPYENLEEDDITSIDDVFNIESCNKYLKDHDGYILELFDGHIYY